jgi:alanyl-tRNA synthetase
MDSKLIRKAFLDFFEKKGHKIAPSDSLVPSSDPTLLFTSAGMVQFKKHFLGQSLDPFTRAATCQKCFRTTDIDLIGKTNRHLTFFEMLGNFSFGDYFKNEAIAWAWEFFTKELKLRTDNLYITVYKDDNEAYDIWKKIVPGSKITRLGDETNFWNMGPTGPCGPCSEILADLGPDMGCGKTSCGPACDCNRYLEIWNLVFTQFDRQEDGSLKNLPRKNIDTGMGFERLVALENGKTNVFDTDLFEPLIHFVTASLDIDPRNNLQSLRTIADHARAVTFLLADGILPSNEGRGYVLRRILRRAVRQVKLLGADEPFLYKIAGEAMGIMKQAYPELEARRESVISITKMEEEKFFETLEAGTQILENLIGKYQSSGVQKTGSGLATKFMIPGNEAFKLYDTYGFPIELTREIAGEKNIGVDEAGFAEEQKRAQEKSRAAWSGSGDKDLSFYSKLQKETGNPEFAGYDTLLLETTIKELVRDGRPAGSAEQGDEAELILAKTPFYAESGGQVADRGIISNNGFKAEIIDVYKPAEDFIVHKVKVLSGSAKKNDVVTAMVNAERRQNIMNHHTATHLLHKALRDLLGAHVAQAGSLVTPDSLRFDFTHFAAIKEEELKIIEDNVNEAVRRNVAVCVSNMKLDEARKKGAMALFGEKYRQDVRAIIIQGPLDEKPHSMELCGGTHVSRTGDIGLFKILSDSSIAAGTRRIEAVAGRAAEKYVREIENSIRTLAQLLKSSRAELVGRAEKLIAAEKEAEKEISRLKMKIATGGASDSQRSTREIDGFKLVTSKVSDMDQKAMRSLSDSIKAKIGSGIVILANVETDKISFTVTLTEDVSKAGYNAGAIAREIAALIGGSGGGRPEFAQGGGKETSKLDEALEKAPQFIRKGK